MKALKNISILFIALFLAIPGTAQTDTEFWFGAPKITQGHGTGGVPIYIRIASLALPAQVTISIPADPAFTPITLNLGANDAQTVDVSAFRTFLENDPYVNITPVNKGIRILSDNMITAYYEVGTHLNPDIFALKGRNALGTEFYVPFQNYFRNGNYNPQPYSSIILVAVEDNTEVTITPTRPAFPGRPAGVPFTVTLNRGQTFAVGPENMTSGGFPRQGQLPENRLAGTHIVSSRPIAVTTADDSVDAHPHAGCKDLIGDQIVPVSIIGTEYIAMRGRLTYPLMRESVYITGTAAGTTIEIDGATVGTIGAGQVYQHLFTQPRHHIKTSEPAYVFHVAGFGCEMGGGILPPVNVCTGSTQVSFTRSKGESFFMNVLVRAGAEDGFILNGNPNLIQAGDFHAVPGTPHWLAAEFEFNQTVIPIAQASLLVNTKDVFHLGIINGGPTSGTMYGYFSDFNELRVRAMVAGTTSNVLRTCYGVPVRLYASGGTRYHWEPHTSLDDPTIATPLASPLVSTLYRVSVSGACNMADTATISVQVSTPVEALFTFENANVCAPEEVTFYNRSTGGVNFRWYVDNTLIGMTATPDDITHVFGNNTNAPIQHTIELVVRNADGCSHRMQRTITVYPAIRSDFSASIVSGCDPVAVEFTNLSSGNTDKWYWDFGDGTSSAAEEPSHLFLNRFSADDAVFPVTLVAISPFQCRDTAVREITVSPWIEAGFMISNPVGCAPWELEITDVSTGATGYHWDFGNGDTSSASGEEFIYTWENNTSSSAVYTIRQRVTNAQGCEDETEREVTVHPAVTAAFSAGPEEGCSPHTVNFTNLSAGASEYRWEFGDGSASSIDNPQHTWPLNLTGADIIYDVTLAAISPQGCTDTARTEITVHPWIEASFTIDHTEGCHPLTVDITNNSRGVTIHSWDFGDGTHSMTDETTFSHTYTNTGNSDEVYRLKLVVENDQGCRDSIIREVTVYPELTANFTPSAWEGCEPLVVDFAELSKNAVSWEWDFGDGTGSSDRNPSHIYINTGEGDLTRQVSLTTTSANGLCTATNTWNITVHGRVRAAFDTGPTQGCNPFGIDLENRSTGASHYRWELGDGSVYETGSDEPFMHFFHNSSFSDTQYFNVMLVAENYAGCTSEAAKTIGVLPDIIAGFTASATSGCHPLTVAFTNNTGGGYRYRWEFGDGNSSDEENPVHTFTNTGSLDSTYRVLLIAYAGNNTCIDSHYIDIVVHPHVVAGFTFDGNPGCNPHDIIIDNISINSSVNTWDFGDGTGRITYDNGPLLKQYSNPSYDNPAVYSIILRAESDAGCSSTMELPLTIYPRIEAEFGASTVSGCHPLEVDFTNFSRGAATYSWNFGDGNSSDAGNPSHIFLNTGTADIVYRVGLVATAPNNSCTDTFFMDIRVHPLVRSEFSIPENTGCTPFNVTFINSSGGAAEYIWDFGDGNGTVTYNQDPVTHQFVNHDQHGEAVYLVGMTAVSTAGCTAYSEKSVTLHPRAEALFDASVTEGCHPLGVDFSNLSQGSTRHEWDFGDGMTSVENSPHHIFTNTGNLPLVRTVTLRTYTAGGCYDDSTMEITIHPNPRARFEIDNTATCPPFNLPILNTSLDATSYTWIFGDGNSRFTGSRELFHHTYDNHEAEMVIYKLTLEAESDYGCTDTASQQVMVYPRVHASFSAITSGCSPLQVEFDNGTTGAVNYRWDFGDGIGIGARNPTHIYYNHSGIDTSYRVSLSAISEFGCSDSASRTITVYPQPEAEFTVTPVFQEYPSVTVEIENASNPGDWQYEWDFGDGRKSAERNPLSYQFGEWGEYNIRLRVWSGNCADSASRRIYIRPPAPVASFMEPAPGCVPHTVQFRHNSIYGTDFHWDFDDGTTSAESEPVHTFREHGVYNVRLTVSGEGGTDYYYQSVEVYRAPRVNFRVVPDQVLLPDAETKLFNMSEYGARYEWDFGDGTYSDEKDPIHLYTQTGVYDIGLTVWTEHGCTGYLHLPRAITVEGSGNIVFPNAFRPDPSGPSGGYYDLSSPLNNIFRPLWEGVAEYRLRIYNRWGEFLFESNDVMQGWDGYYNGQLCKQDVYVWKSWVTFTNGNSVVLAGDVTLLR